MTAIRNIFACLVHENLECVVDLVRNLRYLDPASTILLYNGGQNPGLLADNFPFERYGAMVHPQPRPLAWGRLHDFALDCMQFALDHLPFDILTIVDSDQLAIRPGYSPYLGRFLAGQRDVGLIGSSAVRQPSGTSIGPARAAFKEIELWRPLLRRFPEGEDKFVHWSFWPGTVFTAAAARDLTQLFATDAQLQDIMKHTRIWATEEIIFPTLVVLLGYRVVANPCGNDYVKYRVSYQPQHLNAAMARPDVFWMHPVARRYEDGLRKYIRARFNHYEQVSSPGGSTPMAEVNTGEELLLTLPILARMKAIEGWLEEDEADLLIAATARALSSFSGLHALVEIGSHCGRSSVVLGSVAKAVCPGAKVYAIDPHDGKLGALDQGIRVGPPTLEKFKRNIAHAGLAGIIEIIQKHSFDVLWDQPISLLLIDGLHDYMNVVRDFTHFEPSVVAGGYVAFHDYADYYPGVKTFVNELLASGQYRQVSCVRTMMVVQKQSAVEPASTEGSAQRVSRARTRGVPGSALTPAARRISSTKDLAQEALVSCIMPTTNRRAFVPQAIQYFLRQDYPNRELIVVDDGAEPVEDLIPPDLRVRYMRLEGKHTVGAKRNLACKSANGEIIVHWDDDDWMANRRLSYQVTHLLGQRADICGLDKVFFYDTRSGQAWRYVYPQGGRPWVAGGTLCYTKRFWSENPFPELNIGEDTHFLWSRRSKQIVALPDSTFYAALIHPGNTSPKQTQHACWHSHPIGELRDLIGEDWLFYANLLQNRELPP